MYLLINALAFSLFLYLLAIFRSYKRRRGLPYPPGPPSWPIIGNLLDIPKDTPWTVYADMWRASSCRSQRVSLAQNVKSRRRSSRGPWVHYMRVKYSVIFMGSSWVHDDTYKSAFQPVQTQCVLLEYLACFLLTPVMRLYRQCTPSFWP